MNSSLIKSQRLGQLIASIAFVSLIAGCGGGGSDPAPTTSSVVAPQTQVVGSGAVQDLAAYQGTWLDICTTLSVPNGATYGSSQEKVVIGPISAAGTVSVVDTTIYYTSTNCTGAILATLSPPAAVLSSVGTKTIAGLTALKADAARPAGNLGYSGTVAVEPCGGLPNTPNSLVVKWGVAPNITSICTGVSQPAETAKLIFSQVSAGNTFDIGNEDDLDAAGYPNSFLPASQARYTKQ